MRWPRSWGYRHVPDGGLCTFHGARSGGARSNTRPARAAGDQTRRSRYLARRSRAGAGSLRDGLKLRGYRFEGDTICQASRFQTLRTVFGAAFAGTELPDSAANPAGMKARGKAPHSVFTGDLIDAPGQPTRRAVDEVIAFFRKALLEEQQNA